MKPQPNVQPTNADSRQRQMIRKWSRRTAAMVLGLLLCVVTWQSVKAVSARRGKARSNSMAGGPSAEAKRLRDLQPKRRTNPRGSNPSVVDWCPVEIGWTITPGSKRRKFLDEKFLDDETSDDVPSPTRTTEIPLLSVESKAALETAHAAKVDEFDLVMERFGERRIYLMYPVSLELPTESRHAASTDNSESQGANEPSTAFSQIQMEDDRSTDARTQAIPPQDESEATAERLGGRTARWTSARMQLVSLIMNEVPVAYSSSGSDIERRGIDQIPAANLDMGRSIYSKEQLRSLDSFEREALTRLQAGESVVVESAPGEIRMLGAIRAKRDCLNCHRNTQGDLLGAFTYRLIPESSRKNAIPEARLPRAR